MPRFLTTATNITVGPGDRAVLRCRVENLGTKTVRYTLMLGLNTIYLYIGAFLKHLKLIFSPVQLFNLFLTMCNGHLCWSWWAVKYFINFSIWFFNSDAKVPPNIYWRWHDASFKLANTKITHVFFSSKGYFQNRFRKQTDLHNAPHFTPDQISRTMFGMWYWIWKKRDTFTYWE